MSYKREPYCSAQMSHIIPSYSAQMSHIIPSYSAQMSHVIQMRPFSNTLSELPWHKSLFYLFYL